MVLVQDLESSDQNYLFFPGFWRAATVCLTGKGEQVTLFQVLMVLLPAHCSEVRSFWVPALDSDCSCYPHREDPGGRKDSHLNGASDYDSTGEARGLQNPEETKFLWCLCFRSATVSGTQKHKALKWKTVYNVFMFNTKWSRRCSSVYLIMRPNCSSIFILTWVPVHRASSFYGSPDTSKSKSSK